MSLAALARMLGIKPGQAEDALHSERAARAVLSRRDLFAAGGALAAGSVFSFAPVWQPNAFMLALADVHASTWLETHRTLAYLFDLPVSILVGESASDFRDRARRVFLEETRKALS